MVAVLLAAASVGAVAKLIGSIVAIYYGMFLLLVLAGFIAKGMIYMLGSPDEDEDEEEEAESESASVDAGERSDSAEADSNFEETPRGQ